jgi:hypothetical protein
MGAPLSAYKGHNLQQVLKKAVKKGGFATDKKPFDYL